MSTITQIPITGTIAPPTDKEKLEALLTEFGAEYDTFVSGRVFVLTCQEGMKRISGDSDCRTDFIFGLDGKFIEMGAWE